MHDDMLFRPLPRDEVAKAVERRGPVRIPLVRARWWGEGLREQYAERLAPLEPRYPEDAAFVFTDPFRPEDMGLSWSFEATGARDAQVVLDDWAKLDEFVAKLPDSCTVLLLAPRQSHLQPAREGRRTSRISG